MLELNEDQKGTRKEGACRNGSIPLLIAVVGFNCSAQVTAPSTDYFFNVDCAIQQGEVTVESMTPLFGLTTCDCKPSLPSQYPHSAWWSIARSFV